MHSQYSQGSFVGIFAPCSYSIPFSLQLLKALLKGLCGASNAGFTKTRTNIKRIFMLLLKSLNWFFYTVKQVFSAKIMNFYHFFRLIALRALRYKITLNGTITEKNHATFTQSSVISKKIIWNTLTQILRNDKAMKSGRILENEVGQWLIFSEKQCGFFKQWGHKLPCASASCTFWRFMAKCEFSGWLEQIGFFLSKMPEQLKVLSEKVWSLKRRLISHVFQT